MHMADALVSPAVGGVMIAASAGVMAYAVATAKKDELNEKKLPVMGVMGAFVFAAQMINFTIPGTGSSGHLCGGILLAAMLGASPAYLTLAIVLGIQAFFFADGGLLALGANIWNMGFYTCFIAYPFIFKAILKKGITKKRITLASVVSVIAALQLGAFSVVVETVASGVTDLPFAVFAAMMQPIHLAIGAVEGVVTAAILCFVHQAKPELLESTLQRKKLPSGIRTKKLVIGLAAAALCIGGLLSWFASTNPDGLEWSIEKITGRTEIAAGTDDAYAAAEELQTATAVLPDYTFADSDESNAAAGTSVSGIVGGVLVCAAAAGTGAVIVAVKKRKRSVSRI